MQTTELAVTSDLVLVGGGHSHLFVLKQFAMKPLPGLRLTLVTRDLHTPYSGMLPGFIAGHYAYDEAHIDLLPLARYAGARVIHGTVNALDADRKQLSIEGRPPLDYDLLSINIGSRPDSPSADGPDQRQFAVKPVDRFVEAWRGIEQRLSESDRDTRLAIIGGGAGGVELALSLDFRARQLTATRARLKPFIVTDRDHLLPGHNRRTRAMFEAILGQRSIPVYYERRIDRFEQNLLQGEFAEPIAADVAIWVTHASPAAWLVDSGLELERGFVAVNACLQSVSHEDVFAAGDIAAVLEHPRPRSGVFAVRQGIPLARNLALRHQGRALRKFQPQRQFLSLISTGNRYAVASRGAWALQGRLCWWLKDRIDRKFVRRFSELPQMGLSDDRTAGPGEDLAPMRCGGCGSKVGSETLTRVLEQIHEKYGIAADSGFEHADDAALIRVPPGMDLIQSVDHFRSFIDDPYLFGKIATNHALGDLHAMGVQAHSAMVIANVVYASEVKQYQDLLQLMSGVVETLQAHQTLLVGGHSGEALQMSCGLSVNGFGEPGKLMLKAGVQPGDALILTKPLGSGVLFAADMRARARGEWIDAALTQMLVSNRDAARCVQECGGRACTDVTGFGLAGHLYEMLRASTCSAELYIERVPLLDGAAELAGNGITSSLQPQNARIRHAIVDSAKLAQHEAYPLLFDPQTAGGLLASVADERADECLRQLKLCGYEHARIIGRASAITDPIRILRLTS